MSSEAGSVWIEKTDPKSGKPYYVNTATKETSWKKPEGFASTTTTGPGASTPPPTKSGSGTPGPSTAVAAGGGEWVEKTDPKSGKTYYVNTATKETTWTRPAAMTATAASEVTAGTSGAGGGGAADDGEWVERTDPKTGKTFYMNSKTKATAWRKPNATGASDSNSASTNNNNETNIEPAAGTATESLWTEKTDPKSGKVYYVNKQTKETTWTRPAEYHPAATPASAAATTPMPTVPSSSSATPAATTSAAGSGSATWVEKTDPKSGKPYYVNTVTKETSWKKPEGFDTQGSTTVAGGSSVATPPPPAGSSTPGPSSSSASEWFEKVDPATGKTYYVNKTTKATSWTKPPGWDDHHSPAVGSSTTPGPTGGGSVTPGAATPGASAANDAPATVWVEKADPKTGRLYYFNVKTRETTWSKPVGFGVAAGSGSPSAAVGLSQQAEYPVFDTDTFGSIAVFYGNPNLRSVERLAGGKDGTRWYWERLDSCEASCDFDSTLHAVSMYQFDNAPHVVVLATRRDLNLPVVIDVPLTQDLLISKGHNTQTTTTATAATGASGSALRLAGSQRFTVAAHGSGATAVPKGIVVTGGFQSIADRAVVGTSILVEADSSNRFQLPDMQVPRASHALSALPLSAEGKLAWAVFATGGFDGSVKTRAVERYVLGQPFWERLAPMNHPRAAHQTVFVARTLYAIGGRSGYGITNTCEMLHVQTSAWHAIAPMRQPRANFGCAATHVFVFAVGGTDGRNALTSVEMYDTRTDVWFDVAPLSVPRSMHGCCALPNAQRVETANKQSQLRMLNELEARRFATS